MSDDDGSVGFAPRRVTSSGGSRATIVVVATVALMALAVLKPWSASGPATGERARASSPAVSPSAAVAPESSDDAPRLTSRRAVEQAIEARDGWGVRLVVDAPQTPGDDGLQELWLPSAPAIPGSIRSLSGGIGDLPTFAIADGSLRLVGFTGPPDAVIDDVSFVVGRPLGRATTLRVTPVFHRSGGARSFLMRSHDGSPWPPGVYQFRFLLDGESAALTLAILDEPARP